MCILETDADFKILRQAETNCGEWDGDIVFQEINPTNLILYIVETNTIFKPSLAKLQINRKTLTYYFDKVVTLNMGEDLSCLRGLSDGKKHYIVNLVRAVKSDSLAHLKSGEKADSLLVLTIENGVSQGVQSYLLPDLSDIKETWKRIFKDRYVMFCQPSGQKSGSYGGFRNGFWFGRWPCERGGFSKFSRVYRRL